eukprot:5191371-Amphidinium_carterae.1
MQIHHLRALPLTKITDIPIQPDCAAFSYPSSVKGLGFTSLKREVAAHRVAHLLTERFHHRGDSGEWSHDSIATFD